MAVLRARGAAIPDRSVLSVHVLALVQHAAAEPAERAVMRGFSFQRGGHRAEERDPPDRRVPREGRRHDLGGPPEVRLPPQRMAVRFGELSWLP